jgi:exonuclease 3'-5' domain-containing protein 1
MELATRIFSRRCVNGLAKCIDRDIHLSISERDVWKKSKEKGLILFAPERGGSYKVFNARPLSEDIVQYCIEDVRLMPRLWQQYNSRMGARWKTRVQQATKDRVSLSQTASYNGQGRHMALAPTGWA